MVIIDCFMRGKGIWESFSEEFVSAASDLGTRWPGKSTFQFADQYPKLEVTLGQIRWPQFLAVVFEQRSWLHRLAYCDNSLVRWSCFRVMGEKWPDSTTRELLTDRAVQDESDQPRSSALKTLAKEWPDEATRKLLTERAVQDEGGGSRSAALEMLAEKWSDDSARELLVERAVQDKEGVVRGAALKILADRWPNDATRELLTKRAMYDEDDQLRSSALKTLAEKWPDDITRELLGDRAVRDTDDLPRITALQTLAEKWPDDATRKLLIERSVQDGVAAFLLGRQHSEFGRLVLTRDIDGIRPYLDPTKPVSRERIEQAAQKAGVVAEQVDETVRSLSKHLGWNVTLGSAVKPATALRALAKRRSPTNAKRGRGKSQSLE
jgi:hypothetical protein